ncbi:hypothetical protein NCC49_005296 [Naganishia albida]|nr:hypothetical protein NCC49_005296 [Naganishia albida]
MSDSQVSAQSTDAAPSVKSYVSYDYSENQDFSIYYYVDVKSRDGSKSKRYRLATDPVPYRRLQDPKDKTGVTYVNAHQETVDKKREEGCAAVQAVVNAIDSKKRDSALEYIDYNLGQIRYTSAELDSIIKSAFVESKVEYEKLPKTLSHLAPSS